MSRAPPLSRLCAVLTFALVVAGCEKAMQNMYDQPRYKPGAASALFGDGAADRPPPEGSVAVDAPQGMAPQPPTTLALMQRGRERYGIYCEPCHGIAGNGHGMVPARGFPNPPSFHSDRLRAIGDAEIYRVITRGYGIMYPYANRVSPRDRWAIIAYIRALQLSQHAPLSALAPEDLAPLGKAGE
jgi:mono/diheme cytochrome c family protein